MYSNASRIDDFWQAIILAISTQRVIQVKLASGWRTLDPYQLGYYEEKEKDIMLYGYCRDAVPDATVLSRWQYFSLSDIKEIEVTNYCFEPLIEYDEYILTTGLVTVAAVESKSRK